MQLFYKYNLWSFFSILTNFLFKDFLKKLSLYLNKEIKISIVRDKDINLACIKKGNWMLIKNSTKYSTSGKLRFLMQENDFQNFIKLTGEERLMEFFGLISQRLKRLTYINEINYFTVKEIFDPESLGHEEKYYAIKLILSLPDKSFQLLFILRDEMLLFPFGRISSDYILNIPDSLYRKAFIELDKKIIWHGMNNWSEKLKKKMQNLVENYPVEKYRLYSGNDKIAYSLLMQYLHILKLLFNEKKFK